MAARRRFAPMGRMIAGSPRRRPWREPIFAYKLQRRRMNEENRRIYTFDSFQVDPARRRLWRAGVPVQINSKTFELLLVLIEHSGQALEKDLLLELVWPNQVVEE